MNRTLVHTTLALLALILALAALALIAAPQPQSLALLAACLVLWGVVYRLRASAWNGALLFALIWLAFPLLKPLNQHWLHSHADALLAALDSRLWGGKPLPAWFHYEAHPALTDLLAACYFAFFPIVLGGVAYYAWRRSEPSAARFYNGLIGIYLAGLAGYLLLPAAGPAFTTLPDQGAGGILAPAIIAIVKDGVTGMDVFPSLHTALTLYITAFLWRDGKRKTAIFLAPVTAGTIAATIWLRYHYGVDDLAGLALALAALYGSREKTG
jgi:PAP2 family protein